MRSTAATSRYSRTNRFCTEPHRPSRRLKLRKCLQRLWTCIRESALMDVTILASHPATRSSESKERDALLDAKSQEWSREISGLCGDAESTARTSPRFLSLKTLEGAALPSSIVPRTSVDSGHGVGIMVPGLPPVTTRQRIECYSGAEISSCPARAESSTAYPRAD